jgi:hypothetical protein
LRKEKESKKKRLKPKKEQMFRRGKGNQPFPFFLRGTPVFGRIPAKRAKRNG